MSWTAGQGPRRHGAPEHTVCSALRIVRTEVIIGSTEGKASGKQNSQPDRVLKKTKLIWVRTFTRANVSMSPHRKLPHFLALKNEVSHRPGVSGLPTATLTTSSTGRGPAPPDGSHPCAPATDGHVQTGHTVSHSTDGNWWPGAHAPHSPSRPGVGSGRTRVSGTPGRGVSTTSRTPHLPARTSTRAGHDSEKRLRVTHRKAARPAWVRRGGLSVMKTTTFYSSTGHPASPPRPPRGRRSGSTRKLTELLLAPGAQPRNLLQERPRTSQRHVRGGARWDLPGPSPDTTGRTDTDFPADHEGPFPSGKFVAHGEQEGKRKKSEARGPCAGTAQSPPGRTHQ